jgi:hypothetical protein
MMSGDSSDLPVHHRFLSERPWLNFALVGGLLAFTVWGRYLAFAFQ